MVLEGNPVFVHEERVSSLPGVILKGERDQVSEAAPRQRVLVGKEPIVGAHGEFRPGRHRLGEQPGAQGPGNAGRDRSGKEKPDVRAVAGPGTLHRRPQPRVMRRLHVGCDVLLPASLVEINGQEPTAPVLQEGINSDDVPALEVVQDYLVGDVKEGLVRTSSALHLRLPAHTGDPLVGAGRGVPLLARLPIPPKPRKNVFSSGKEGSKEGDLLLFGFGRLSWERQRGHHRPWLRFRQVLPEAR